MAIGLVKWVRPPRLQKVAIVLVAIPVLVFVFQISWAGALRDRNPELALMMAPFDATAQANKSAQLLARSQAPNVLEEARELAGAAIARAPLTVAALRTLGLIAVYQRDDLRARGLFRLSQRESRRDLPTQLWLIEYYVQAGDIQHALVHYDIALRTSEEAKQLLFPILVSASTHADLVEPLARTLRRKPPQWWREFAAALIADGQNLPNVVRITSGVLAPEDPQDRALITTLITRLVTANQFDLAWGVYAQAQPRSATSSNAQVRGGDFERGGDFPPLDWFLAEEPELNAARGPRPDNEGNALWLVAYNGRAGEVARQLVHLPTGRYSLGAEMGQIPAAAPDRPTFVVRCAGVAEGRTLLTLQPPPTTRAMRLSEVFSVPENCPWQWLALSASGLGAQSDTPPWIDNIAVNRMAN